MQGWLTVERYAADPSAVERYTATIWAELAFDETALAGLRRDGLMLDGVRLTGPSPFIVTVHPDDKSLLTIAIDETHRQQQDMLLALWHIYFLKRVHSELPQRR